MLRHTGWVAIAVLCGGVATAAAQATGMPSFNAPYRAFQRSEFGAVISFPNSAGTAIEGAYRYAAGRFDIGLRGGMWDPGSCCKTELLVGVEARERVITHTTDFPLDGALVFGAGGALVSGGSTLFIPVGLSLGRRVESKGSSISFVPYVEPTATLVADGGSTLDFTLGVGVDVGVSKTFDARFAAGVGDLDGVSIGAVWVH
jgi:hypothetical protein